MKIEVRFIDSKGYIVSEFYVDWNDRAAVQAFAIKANAWLRAAKHNEVRTRATTDNVM